MVRVSSEDDLSQGDRYVTAVVALGRNVAAFAVTVWNVHKLKGQLGARGVSDGGYVMTIWVATAERASAWAGGSIYAYATGIKRMVTATG